MYSQLQIRLTTMPSGVLLPLEYYHFSIPILQGALHVMLLPSIMTVYVHDWQLMAKTLPALVTVSSAIIINSSNNVSII